MIYENRRLTKEDRLQMREMLASHAEYRASREATEALIDELDAADEEIKSLSDAFWEAGETAFQFAEDYARLREALELIVNIQSTANEHALLTTVRMATIARTALSGSENEEGSHGQ